MGADIHGYIEYSKDGSKWDSWASRIHLSRRYGIFGILAGVRSGVTPMFPLRGIPRDLSWDVIHDYYEPPVKLADLSGHERAEVETYKQALLAGAKSAQRDIHEVRDLVFLANQDWHSPGWLWCEEYNQLLEKLDEKPPCYVAVAHAMRGLEAGGAYSVRFVFWFDN